MGRRLGETRRAIEMILARQLASTLKMPIFITDPRGTLVFFNEAAEALLGQRFAETDELPISDLAARFKTTDADGRPLPNDELPITTACFERRPAHRSFWICGLDNVPRHIEVTSFPLLGQDTRFLGAIAVFWEVAEKRTQEC